MHAERVSATFSDWKLYMGAGEVIPEGTVPLDCLDQPFVSKKFQWLPADIIVDSNGSVKFLSYINTMHPQWHAPLYAATATLLQRMLPLFERVLAAAAVPQHRAVSPPEKIWVPDAEAWLKENGSLFDTFPPPFLQPNFGLYYQERSFQEAKITEQYVAPPTPPAVNLCGRILQVCHSSPNQVHTNIALHLFPLHDGAPSTVFSFGQPTVGVVQVIVRYAAIDLTPDQPKYEGGAWHVEGMGAEHIVASAVAYFRCDNITTSRLEFRRMVDEPPHALGSGEPVLCLCMCVDLQV